MNRFQTYGQPKQDKKAQVQVEGFTSSPARLGLTILSIAFLIKLSVLWIAVFAPQRVLIFNGSNSDQYINGNDSDQYIRLATNLVEHNVFSLSENSPFVPDTRRTPGYPTILALLYLLAGRQHSVLLIVLTQIVLALVNIYLIIQIGRKLFDPLWIVYVAALIYALAPASMIRTGSVMTETVFTTTLLAGILTMLLVRQDQRMWSYTVLSGILFALSVYIRPIALYFIPIPMLALLIKLRWQRQAIFLTLLMGATFMLTLFPWFVRNYTHFQSIIFSSIANENLLWYNVSSIEAQRRKVPSSQITGEIRKKVHDQLQAVGITNPNQAQMSKIMGEVAIEYIRKHPFASFIYQFLDMSNSLRPGYSSVTLLLSDDASEFGRAIKAGNLSVVQQAPMPDKVIYLLFTIYYFAFYSLIAIGLLILMWRRSWLILAVCGLTSFWFMYAPGAAGNARFRAPVEGLLAIIAAVGLCVILSKAKLIHPIPPPIQRET